MATYVAAANTAAAVQAAMDLATAAGDIVEIPADAGGTGWTAGVSWNAPANATLRGAGTSATGGGDQTVIIDDYNANARLIEINMASSGTFRMTGITVQSGTAVTAKDGGTIMFSGEAELRIDHCHLDFSGLANYQVLTLYNTGGGVADHNIFDYGSQYQGIYCYNGRKGASDAVGNFEWSLPTAFGGETFFFFEDNVFTGNEFTTRIIDAQSGSKFVVRFNDIHDLTVSDEHGTGHAGNDRGVKAKEVYGNSCTSDRLAGGPNQTAVNTINGTALFWGNSWNQVYKNIYTFIYTRKNCATYTQNVVPTGWGYTGGTPKTGTVDVTGTAVTKVSGDDFDTDWPAGTMIYIVGATSTAFAGQEPNASASCAIESVNSTTSITLTNGGHTGDPLTGVTWYVGSVWDGNTDELGYPALDQPGYGQGDLITGDHPDKVNDTTGTPIWPNQALEPVYIWNNTGDPATGWGGFALSNQSGGLVVEDRDFYLPASGIQTSPTEPFDGTSGVGWGTLANRPTTCTAGVAYFAIDQGDWNTSATNPYGVQQNGASGVLYKATAPDTWTEYYEPYTYPHPLQSASAPSPSVPDAPTGLTLTPFGP